MFHVPFIFCQVAHICVSRGEDLGGSLYPGGSYCQNDKGYTRILLSYCWNWRWQEIWGGRTSLES